MLRRSWDLHAIDLPAIKSYLLQAAYRESISMRIWFLYAFRFNCPACKRVAGMRAKILGTRQVCWAGQI
jgi:hypothetical protein